MYSNPGQRFRETLRAGVVGQDNGLDAIENALNSHYAGILDARRAHSSGEGTGPLVLHISGPSGVGKTFCAKLMAKALYRHEDDEGVATEYCGEVYIDLRNYQFPPFNPNGDFAAYQATIGRYQNTLKDVIADQLSVCPRSLFILDEVQLAPVQMMQMFPSMLDSGSSTLEHGGKRVSTRQAIFVFISDLGADAVSDSDSPDVVRSRILQAAKRHADVVLRNQQGKRVGNMMEAAVLVPFLPLSETSMQELIAMWFDRKMAAQAGRVRQLARPGWRGVVQVANVQERKRILDHLWTICKDQSQGSRARGVQTLIETEVMAQVMKYVMQHTLEGTTSLQLAMREGKLHIDTFQHTPKQPKNAPSDLFNMVVSNVRTGAGAMYTRVKENLAGDDKAKNEL